jgi:hypothetical protein
MKGVYEHGLKFIILDWEKKNDLKLCELNLQRKQTCADILAIRNII